MHSGDEEHVALKEKIPVHIVYFTAWPRTAVGSRHGPTCTVHDAKQPAFSNLSGSCGRASVAACSPVTLGASRCSRGSLSNSPRCFVCAAVVGVCAALCARWPLTRLKIAARLQR